MNNQLSPSASARKPRNLIPYLLALLTLAFSPLSSAGVITVEGGFNLTMDTAAAEHQGYPFVFGSWTVKYDDTQVSTTTTTAITSSFEHFSSNTAIGGTTLDASNMEAQLNFNTQGELEEITVTRIGIPTADSELYLIYKNINFTPFPQIFTGRVELFHSIVTDPNVPNAEVPTTKKGFASVLLPATQVNATAAIVVDFESYHGLRYVLESSTDMITWTQRNDAVPSFVSGNGTIQKIAIIPLSSLETYRIKTVATPQ